jgi:hypothetical protein
MIMYPKAVVEAMIDIGNIKGVAATLKERMYEHTDNEDDDMFDDIIDGLNNLQQKLLNVGTEVQAAEEASPLRKVTIAA